jgi:ABC-2 type transport system permease protein
MTSQPVVFRWLRSRLLAHEWHALRVHAKARLLTAAACTLAITAVVFALALEGFLLLSRQSLAGGGSIVGLVFDFLFLTLGLLLVFSGGLILYGSLFTSPEAAFLLALPARADHVFAYKFVGAIGFSSWAFVLLGLPVFAAYGIAFHVAWAYWLALPLLLLGFLPLPGAVGALACLAIVNVVPQHRKQVLIGTAVAMLVLTFWFGYQWITTAITANVADRDAVSGLLGQLEFARAAWAPSHWMTMGLQAAKRGDLMETAFRLALVWSNGLLAYLLASWVSRYLYRRGYNRLQTGGALRKRYGGAWLDQLLDRSLWFLDVPTRLLIVKDFRSFRRDPGQWLQIVIFAALGLIYFINTRQFYRGELGRSFQYGICLVNLVATCLLLCAYMGRFIYPMLSLEGRKFWILGLMPIGRRQLLIGKFAFAAVGAFLLAVPLIVAADVLLGMSLFAIALHAATAAGIALGLSGLAVGIGAMLPNFRETDPSKIAVGYGGTINLLAGLLFILTEIALMAGPYHIHAMVWPDEAASTLFVFIGATCAMVGLLLSAQATFLPLRWGRNALEVMEF